MGCAMYRSFSIMLGESFRKEADEFIKNGVVLSDYNESFRKGYLMGLHRTFTLMEQAADAYKIPLEEISLDGLTETDFLT